MISEDRQGRLSVKSFVPVIAFVLLMALDVHAATGGGEGHGRDWVDFAWRVVNMIVLVGFLYWLLAQKIKEFFVGRREGIKSSLEQAMIAKEEAGQKYKEYTDKLEKATEEIAGISNMIRAQGLAEKERIIEDARKVAEKMKEDTQARVEQELKQAGNLLRAEAVKLSVEMAEELLKRNITDADHDAMVKDYLDKVVSKH
ncbi:MAG: ATP synthase F0 subunit B [Deltaproteobacteria bacterium HGW-Deltaproteobacteria-9]|nr:MAG: ATP synthase F0 subunit B [Deltaproteobacteria bacterium HGW-Deltaproteobacteria-9]